MVVGGGGRRDGSTDASSPCRSSSARPSGLLASSSSLIEAALTSFPTSTNRSPRNHTPTSSQSLQTWVTNVRPHNRYMQARKVRADRRAPALPALARSSAHPVCRSVTLSLSPGAKRSVRESNRQKACVLLPSLLLRPLSYLCDLTSGLLPLPSSCSSNRSGTDRVPTNHDQMEHEKLPKNAMRILMSAQTREDYRKRKREEAEGGGGGKKSGAVVANSESTGQRQKKVRVAS